MIQSLNKFIRSGFNAEASGVCLLLIFFWLLFRSTGELWGAYEFIPSMFWLSLVIAIALWLQSVQYLKKGLKSHERVHYICSAFSAFLLAMMFIFGNALMRNISALSEHSLIIYLAFIYGAALFFFAAATVRRTAQR